MNVFRAVSRRRFLQNGVAIATTWELRRAAHALGFPPASPVCKLVAEQEEGPYYIPDELLRADIREGKPGVPLTLRLAVLDARTCTPLRSAAIDVWQCDALGLYAGFTRQNPMGPGGPGGPGGPPPGGPDGPPPGFRPGFRPGQDPTHPGNRPGPPEGFGPPPPNHTTDELTFLRGIQMTGNDGTATFGTVFPGFYMGRTNHIHFKVRLDGTAAAETNPHRKGRTYLAGHTAHTGQVFFPEEMAAELMRHEPYSRHAIHRTTQAEDAVFTDQHGGLSIATLRPVAGGGAGYHAELIVAVDPTATPGSAQRRGGPDGPGGPPPAPGLVPRPQAITPRS